MKKNFFVWLTTFVARGGPDLFEFGDFIGEKASRTASRELRKLMLDESQEDQGSHAHWVDESPQNHLGVSIPRLFRGLNPEAKVFYPGPSTSLPSSYGDSKIDDGIHKPAISTVWGPGQFQAWSGPAGRSCAVPESCAFTPLGPLPDWASIRSCPYHPASRVLSRIPSSITRSPSTSRIGLSRPYAPGTFQNPAPFP